MITDHSQRQQALDPAGSFIVQAPAGSGKTELLVRRFLVLLAQACASPEEIIAITFTRKAASEMRHRVLSALNAATQPAPSNPHDLATWEIAQSALAQDRRYQWCLLDNPQRLRIQTIDAFCLSLTGQMPLLAGFGAKPQNLPDADDCYLQAARALLENLETKQPIAANLTQLLLHLDNRIDRIESLLVNMLQRRDQWLPYLMTHREQPTSSALRHKLESALQHITSEALTACYQHTPQQYRTEILALLQFAFGTVAPTQPLTHFPEAKLSDHDIWCALASLLLTKENQWRKKIDKTIGFPADNKIMKKRMENLLAALADHEDFLISLTTLRQAPPLGYSDAEWQIVATLIEVLPQLVAQLNVIFREKGVVDFSETAMAALRALGDNEAPTELALILDYQIKHLLVDEFQDTSSTQFRLLEKLTLGWQPDDGRTLFLVGDPMQSIYRFREAEVGLFLKAQQEGLGSVPLVPLQLQTNFRSTPTIVDWLNNQFRHLFPTNIDISSGAVTFNESVAAKEYLAATEVSVHPLLGDDKRLSAEKICALIQHEQIQNPHHTIAVLVRSRTHLTEIIPLLKQHNIAFNAVEIEPLATQSIVHDLTALTRALMHWGDRLAWLAILRAPWCGLNLADLHAIAKHSDVLIWQVLEDFYDQRNDATTTLNISATGRTRLLHIIPILQHFLFARERFDLRTWVEQTWQALNGPACCLDNNEIAIAAVFFDALEQLASENDIVDPSILVEKIHPHYATPAPVENCRLHIMTLHKAKGLEFDTVIIPHLESKGRHDDAQLLLWLDRPRAQQENDLILAPIPQSRKPQQDPIYRYLQSIEQTKMRYEMTRLLYVAATRAKVNLHLIAQVKLHKGELATPDSRSFAALLWQPIKAAAQALLDNTATQVLTDVTVPKVRQLRRLTADYLAIIASENKNYWPSLQGNNKKDRDYLMSTEVLTVDINRHIGTLIHRYLQQISQDGLALWHTDKILQAVDQEKDALFKLGLTTAQLEFCLTRLQSALTLTLNDVRGRWILDNSHREQHSEYAITAIIQGKTIHSVIDRTFIDAQAIRWIIDYKTGYTAADITPELLAQLQYQHRGQLETYAKAMGQLEQHQYPIRLGLYLPDCAKWYEWAYEETIQPA